MVATCGLANGQQQSGSFAPPNQESMQPHFTQTVMPPTSINWQHEAMQMMPPPTQLNVASASSAQSQPVDGQIPQQMTRYLPPVHVSPPSNQNRSQFENVESTHAVSERFTKKTGPLSEFRRTQLSDKSLIRPGPGLQDRIAELIAASRKKAADFQSQAATPQPGMQLPERADEQPPRPIAKMMRPGRQMIEPNNFRQPLIDNVGNQPVGNHPPANRLAERQPASDLAETSLPTRMHPINEADHSIRLVADNISRQPNRQPFADNDSPRIVAESEVAPAALSEPVLTEPDPIQDPFGDYPPLRSEAPSFDQDRLARAQDRSEQPISVLSRSVRHRIVSPNQTFLPSNRSDETYSEPDNGAPTYESESHVMFRDNSDLDDSNANRFSEPPAEPIYEFAPDSQDALDANLDQLEELPGSPGSGNSLRENQIGSTQEAADELSRPTVKRSCDEYRSRLLNNPITDIALDMSPPRSDQKQSPAAFSRTWTDRGGNILATGTMTELSRGYVILDTGQKIARARLSDADILAISDYWQIPEECSLGNQMFAGRCWVPQTVTWKASSLCHKPLYFEDVQLERYGHSHGPFLQPIYSTGHFFVSLAFLPYQMGIHPANECQYALGFYRPGDCAPWLKDPVPISLEGIKLETLTAVGLAYVP